MVIGLANSLVWQFAGPDDYRGRTLIDFSIVQPLLRAGGRIRVLERLTIAERSLLANVRQMERFQRGFYTEIVTGRSRARGLRGGVDSLAEAAWKASPAWAAAVSAALEELAVVGSPAARVLPRRAVTSDSCRTCRKSATSAAM